jgi:hypothetical protein
VRGRVLFDFCVRVGLGVAVGVATGCGSSSAPSPFVSPGDAGADGAPDSGEFSPVSIALPDASVPGEWGGRCVDDGECDDHIECTSDACDSGLGRCHFVPGDAACDDGTFCNGVEQCVPGVGCRPGAPVACSDGTACTIDACDELTHDCVHSARDADGDGDPDGNCPGGGDCNERDPNVSSLHVEICGDTIDNDCDGLVDEPDCEKPAYDTCATALDVLASGQFLLSAAAAAAKKDYSATCLPPDTTFRDLVVALHVPKGEPADVDVAVTTTAGNVALATAAKCGDASTEIACGPGVEAPGRTHAARLRLRGLAPGVYPLYVFSSGAGELVLAVEFAPASTEPTNETCGEPAPMMPGERVVAELVGAKRDLATACGTSFAELVYDFTLAEPRDVHLFATSEDNYGTPLISLRRSPCASDQAELTCRSGPNTELFRRALPSGHYFVSVGATGPSDVSVLLETDAPTAPPADETCAGAPALTLNSTRDVDLAHHEDDIQLGCAAGAVDAAYALTLERDSDVLLVLRIGDDDPGAVSLANVACSPNEPLLACATSETGPLTDAHRAPVRAVARSVPSGEYRVIVESALGTPASVTALVRPPSPPSLVAFSDACDGAQPIPATGGFFKGSTANAADDFTASCDVGGGGAPDQLLSLHLDVPSRVVLDAKGSTYAVIVDVREGATCPGDEVPKACSAGYVPRRSFLDLDLLAGDYWVQVDGYGGASGAWTLDAFIAPK